MSHVRSGETSGEAETELGTDRETSSHGSGQPVERLSALEHAVEEMRALMERFVQAQPTPPRPAVRAPTAPLTTTTTASTGTSGLPPAPRPTPPRSFRATATATDDDDNDAASSATNDNDDGAFDDAVVGPDGTAVSFGSLSAYLCDLDDQMLGSAFVFDIRRIRRIARSLDAAWTATDSEEVRDSLGAIATELAHQIAILETRVEDGPEVAQDAARMLEARVASHPMRRAIATIQAQARRNVKARRPAYAGPSSFAQPIAPMPSAPRSVGSAVPFGGFNNRGPRRESATRPPPYPCRVCGGNHWERHCPSRQQMPQPMPGMAPFPMPFAPYPGPFGGPPQPSAMAPPSGPSQQ